MPRSRNLKFDFFHDVELIELSPLHRLLFCGLWCWADREGRLVDSPKRLKFEILPMDDCDVDQMLTDLAERKFILRYSVNGKHYIEVRNFKKHQNPHYKELPSLIPPVSGLPDLFVATPVGSTQRKRIFERDGFVCAICGSQEDLSIDHIVECIEGGSSDDSNLRTLCRSCNCKRPNRRVNLTLNQVRINVGATLIHDQPTESLLIPDSLIPDSDNLTIDTGKRHKKVSSSDFSEERLTPDVESVHYSDVEDIELPDEGRKSKKQTWSSGDRSKFWGQWKRKSTKPPTHVCSRVNRWLEYKDPSQAVTAINGYASVKLESMSIDEFQRGYWEYYKLGEAEERATSAPLPPSVPLTTISPQAIAPSAPWGPRNAVARWNEIVKSAPVNWDWERDNDRELRQACADPVFEQRFDEICEKAEKANRDGLDRPFRWMLAPYGGKTGQWWKFLDEKPKARFKPQESLEDIKRNLMEKRFGSGKQST